MDAKARIIRSLVFSASSRFASCETQEDFATQQRLYGALLEEGIDELIAAERERCAAVNVIGTKKSADTTYQTGWFDGVEDCQDAIRATPPGKE